MSHMNTLEILTIYSVRSFYKEENWHHILHAIHVVFSIQLSNQFTQINEI
jgi:hypothetical protein